MKSTIFLLICSILYQCTYQDQINVSLYYESLCPDCIRFIYYQLYPGFQKIGDVLILDLTPYGHANQTKINNKWKFNCQHGPRECFANKIQACVLKHHPDIETQMNFVECMMSSSNPASPTNAEHCAISCNLLWTVIEKCSVGREGDEILATYGQKTRALGKLPFVPYLLFNGVYNETLQNAALRDFVKTVCDLLKTKPKGCYTKEYKYHRSSDLDFFGVVPTLTHEGRHLFNFGKHDDSNNRTHGSRRQSVGRNRWE